MVEHLALEPLPRDVLAPVAQRLQRLRGALGGIRAVIEGETDAVALQASLSCMLWSTMNQASWCGFYRRVGPTTLAVGPYQGSLGCLRIDFARGVCGEAARTRRVQRVPDVEVHPDHIACDAETRSELVVPVLAGGELRAVLDLDSHFVDAFSHEEADELVALVGSVFDRPDVVW